ncbi:MAG: methyltransferase domain-containing protein [Chloroflexia bacterium]|nr:methyltransferase domain-containing protein [Chloroflexia bacterium]
MEEIAKIEERYESRKKNKKREDPYFQHFALSERELIYSTIVNKFWSHKPEKLSILEIGAGVGDNLLFFHRIGIPWKNIYANELLSDRVERLKMNLAPASTILPGNALDLDYENSFDIVLQSTVFTSILDSSFKRELALKMMKNGKKRGIIIGMISNITILITLMCRE